MKARVQIVGRSLVGKYEILVVVRVEKYTIAESDGSCITSYYSLGYPKF